MVMTLWVCKKKDCKFETEQPEDALEVWHVHNDLGRQEKHWMKKADR